jgi:hypothetical protein
VNFAAPMGSPAVSMIGAHAKGAGGRDAAGVTSSINNTAVSASDTVSTSDSLTTRPFLERLDNIISGPLLSARYISAPGLAGVPRAAEITQIPETANRKDVTEACGR